MITEACRMSRTDDFFSDMLGLFEEGDADYHMHLGSFGVLVTEPVLLSWS